MKTNERGNYRFLPGSSFLSFAAVAQPGYAIERAVFRTPQPFESFLDVIERHLAERGRPLHALCGLEFRQFTPRQSTIEEFVGFNAGYVKRVAEAGLLVDGLVPIARTNVVVNLPDSPASGGLLAFSYTVLRQSRDPQTGYFIFAAAPEVRFLPGRFEIIEPGGVSPEAIRRKTEFIVSSVDERMADLGLRWADVTGAHLYCEADLHPLLCSLILPRMKAAAWRGVQWIHALPPAMPAIIELDLRSVCADLIID